MSKINKHICLFSCLVFIFFVGCQFNNTDPRDIAARYKNEILSKNELLRSLPKGISSSDSILYAQVYIRSWMLNRIIEHEAERNLSNIDIIEKQVEDYRQELLRFNYMKEIANQKMKNGDPEDSEVLDYYNSNSETYVAKTNYLKYFSIRTTTNNSKIQDLRNKMKMGDLEALDAYSEQNLIRLDVSDSVWTELSIVEKMFPKLSNNFSKLGKDKIFEWSDKDYLVLFKIIDYCPEGSQEPLDLIEPEIKNILKSKWKKKFIDNFEDKLYKDNVANGNIVIY